MAVPALITEAELIALKREAVTLSNPDSPANVLLLCEHAGNRIPDAWQNLGLSDAALETHIACDIGAGAVTRNIADELGATAVLANFSRLFMDLNRPLNHPESIPAASDGVVVPGNDAVVASERALRTEIAFNSFHGTVGNLIDRASSSGRTSCIVTVHSFASATLNGDRPWHAGLVWNKDEAFARALHKRLGCEATLKIGFNQPYSGKSAPSFTVQQHAEVRGLRHASIEVRQNLIDSRIGEIEWTKRLAAALQFVVETELQAVCNSERT